MPGRLCPRLAAVIGGRVDLGGPPEGGGVNAGRRSASSNGGKPRTRAGSSPECRVHPALARRTPPRPGERHECRVVRVVAREPRGRGGDLRGALCGRLRARAGGLDGACLSYLARRRIRIVHARDTNSSSIPITINKPLSAEVRSVPSTSRMRITPRSASSRRGDPHRTLTRSTVPGTGVREAPPCRRLSTRWSSARAAPSTSRDSSRAAAPAPQPQSAGEPENERHHHHGDQDDRRPGRVASAACGVLRTATAAARG